MKKAMMTVMTVAAAAMIAGAAQGVDKRPPQAGESTAATAPAAAPAPMSTIRVAVYPVKTDGFELNQSEVTELHRIAMQACYDAGLRCAGRGETADNVEKEQRYEGRGRMSQAQYVAEFTLVGKTGDKVRLGLPGSITVGGGYGVDIGGVVGGGILTDLSGIGIKMDGMELVSQFSDTTDGALIFSATRSKLALRGSFIIGEAGGSNAKKLLSTFRAMFDLFRIRAGD